MSWIQAFAGTKSKTFSLVKHRWPIRDFPLVMARKNSRENVVNNSQFEFYPRASDHKESLRPGVQLPRSKNRLSDQ